MTLQEPSHHPPLVTIYNDTSRALSLLQSSHGNLLTASIMVGDRIHQRGNRIFTRHDRDRQTIFLCRLGRDEYDAGDKDGLQERFHRFYTTEHRDKVADRGRAGKRDDMNPTIHEFLPPLLGMMVWCERSIHGHDGDVCAGC